MLILSRTVDEAIVIGGPARIVVTSIRGNQVNLGIEAEPHVKIFREETLPEKADGGALADPPVDYRI